MFFLFIVHFVGNTARTKMHCWDGWLLNIYKKIFGKIISHKCAHYARQGNKDKAKTGVYATICAKCAIKNVTHGLQHRKYSIENIQYY